MNIYKVKVNDKTYVVATDRTQDFVFGAMIGNGLLKDGDKLQIETIQTGTPIAIMPIENPTFKNFQEE